MLDKLDQAEKQLEKKMDHFVDKLGNMSDSVYFGVAELNRSKIQTPPLNSKIYIVILILSSLLFLPSFFNLSQSGYWQKTNANLSYFNLETIELRSTNPRGPYDYRASVRYTYRYDGRLYTGNKFYADQETNIFNKRADAESLVGTARPGADMTVYVDPARPWESAIHGGGFSPPVFFQMLGIMFLYLSINFYSLQVLRVI